MAKDGFEGTETFLRNHVPSVRDPLKRRSPLVSLDDATRSVAHSAIVHPAATTPTVSLEGTRLATSPPR